MTGSRGSSGVSPVCAVSARATPAQRRAAVPATIVNLFMEVREPGADGTCRSSLASITQPGPLWVLGRGLCVQMFCVFWRHPRGFVPYPSSLHECRFLAALLVDPRNCQERLVLKDEPSNLASQREVAFDATSRSGSDLMSQGTIAQQGCNSCGQCSRRARRHDHFRQHHR